MRHNHPIAQTQDVATPICPAATREIARTRRELDPEIAEAFHLLGQKVFADGALTAKTKQIIAVAVAHVTQCPYCIQGHTRAALRGGASPEELMDAIWVAAELRAGAAFAHSNIAIAKCRQWADSLERRWSSAGC
jgi:AhpD family alkylhydroperoxidase